MTVATRQYAKTVSRAFELFQPVVNTDPAELKEARRRRDLFDRAFEDEHDVDDVFCSGSLARKTHKDPIHDVDSVVVYRTGSRPSWGLDGPSAKAALDEVQSRTVHLLGVEAGTRAREVTAAVPRNHAVRCEFGALRGHGFTVDVMPALRVPGGLLVPVAREDRWEVVNPQDLIRRTRDRQAVYDDYVPLVRTVKFWKDERKTVNSSLDAKSLLIEVLAYELLDRARPRQEALERFFTAAGVRVRRGTPVQIPGSTCGPVQPDLNVGALLTELDAAADLACRANMAERAGDHDTAIRRWGQVFGESFPTSPPNPGLGTAWAATGALVPAQSGTAAAAPRRLLRDEPQG